MTRATLSPRSQVCRFVPWTVKNYRLEELTTPTELRANVASLFKARDAVADRIAGLDTGADDYLVKPFDLNELAARLRALLRRRSGRATPVIEHGPLVLDPATHEVRLNGDAIRLSGREFALLHALLQDPGVPLSRSQLEDRLYGWDEEIGSNAVEVHIHALRRKIGGDLVRNVRGVGYMVPKRP